MKVGDKFTIGSKEYEAVNGYCSDCAFNTDTFCPDYDLFPCIINIIAKEVSK